MYLASCGRAPKLYALVDHDLARITPKEMVAAAEAGDVAVYQELVQAAQYLGIAIANAVSLLHPEQIVLSGSVAQIGDLLVHTVKEVLSERVGMFSADHIQIILSTLGNRAGQLGGIALAQQRGITLR